MRHASSSTLGAASSLGLIAGIEDGFGFHADTVPGLVAAFEAAVDDYLETCARVGNAPGKSYSGR